MSEPRAYLNGWTTAAHAVVPIYDAGFVLGTTVSEQLRTFAGRLFRLDEHLDRLFASLSVVGVEPGLGRGELARIAEELVAHNHALLAPGDDLGLSMFVTPGPYATLAGGRPALPTVGLHTYPLPTRLWAEEYDEGVALAVSSVRQVPGECWPTAMKCRSRMHYYLADQEVRRRQPGARALLLDDQGHVSETATSNVVMYRPGAGLVSPRREQILPGISLAMVRDLAAESGLGWIERDLTPCDLAEADELLLTSTPSCVLPVTRFEGGAIGSGQPGDVFRALLAAWSAKVGVDIARQAREFAGRLEP